MKNKNKSIWLSVPEEHDFPAAQDYLDLHFEKSKVDTLVDKLREAETSFKKAKDIIRASRLPLLGIDNKHVKHNLKKVKKGEKLSPVLLVRNEERLIIADGYHRISAAYMLGEDTQIPCRLV